MADPPAGGAVGATAIGRREGRMEAEIVTTLVGSGPLGLVILYMMFLQKQDRDTRKEERARRDEIDKDRIETDKALVATLTMLTAKIDELGK
jgi:hypothetical protein